MEDCGILQLLEEGDSVMQIEVLRFRTCLQKESVLEYPTIYEVQRAIEPRGRG